MAAEVLDALLQGAVEAGLSPDLGIPRKQEDEGSQDEFPPEVCVTANFCFYESWMEEKRFQFKWQFKGSVCLI